MKFRMFGKSGDIVYAMAAVKSVWHFTQERIDIVLTPTKWVDDEFSDQAAKALCRLLKEQEYVGEVEIRATGSSTADCILDFERWFEHRRVYGMNLCRSLYDFVNDRLRYSTQFDETAILKPWLKLDGVTSQYTLVNWNARYPSKNSSEIWAELLKADDFSQMRYLGLEGEEKDFRTMSACDLPRLDTSDLFDAACYIKSCKRLLCSQSVTLAIATGLGVPVAVEVSHKWPDCIYIRENAEYYPLDPERDQEYGLVWINES